MDNETTPLFVVRGNDAERTYAWPCTVAVPKPDGTKEQQRFNAKFKLLSDGEEKELRAPLLVATQNTNLELLKKALVGFEGLQNDRGETVPDADALALIWKLPFTWYGLAAGYWEMRDGRLAKN